MLTALLQRGGSGSQINRAGMSMNKTGNVIDNKTPALHAQSTSVQRELQLEFRRQLAQRSDPATAIAGMMAAASACRTLLADRWAATQAQDAMRGAARRVHYLSMEFLIGRAQGNAFAALDVPCEQVVA